MNGLTAIQSRILLKRDFKGGTEMLEEKLDFIKDHSQNGRIKIMILGLGSVGNYLLDYLLGSCDSGIEIIVAGRNAEKMTQDVNIAKVAAMIRGVCRTNVIVEGNVDLDDITSIETVLKKYDPDFIVNSSRVYAGLKYGSISWKSIRAYGIWTPLSIRYIRNIMIAYKKAGCKGIVINTSYSDATLPWLKSAGLSCPDFGSGNLNHLIPRIKMAVADIMAERDACAASAPDEMDFWNISVTLATAHFHDVVISKEGHTEGIEQLLYVEYNGEKIDIDQTEIFKKCSIAMPVDQKRNMMNASSNYDIIACILRAIRNSSQERFHSPGAFGEIGGYPIVVDGKALRAYIDESCFSIERMREKNRASIALDGVEDISDGNLIYTDDLIYKVKKAFDVELPKTVAFDEIDKTADMIIENIIKPALNKNQSS